MSKVSCDISVSLDGFIAGPGDSVEAPLGEGGDRLHQWVYGLESWRARHGLAGGESDRDAEVLEESVAHVGATVMGRRMFDLGEGPWGEEPPFRVPVFVVTHRPREPLPKKGGTTFHFVPDGIGEAVEQARTAAGDADVSVAGGADVIRQCLRAGLLDDLQLHLVPVLLGGGRRLFDDRGDQPIELETTRVIESPAVTHIRLRLAR